MKSSSAVEWACSCLSEKSYKSLQAHYQSNPIFRFAFVSLALITQVVGLVIVSVIGIFIGSFLLSFLR